MTTRSETGHTPGPWFAFIKGEVIAVGIGNKRKDVDAIVHWTGFDACHVGFDEQAANAKLIAASPDLLEAARQTKWFIENGRELGFIPVVPSEPALQAIRAAISKATGATP